MKTLYLRIETIGAEARIPVERGASWLSKEELDRAGRLRFKMHRERFIRGRALLRQSLSELISCDPRQLDLQTSPTGKPFLSEMRLAFNVSHAEDWAIFAFSTELEAIGADLETLDRAVDYLKLVERYFTPREQQAFDGLTEEEGKALFFRLWTAKEARMKYTGEGLRLPPQRIEIELAGHHPVGYRQPAPTDLPLLVWDLLQPRATVAITADSPFQIVPFHPRLG